MQRFGPATLALLLTFGLSPPARALTRHGSDRRAAITTKNKAPARASHRRALPVPTYTRAGLPNIQAQAALVVDLKGGGPPLYEKNANAVRPIASISKLMAAMVILDRKPDLNALTTITEEDRRLALRGARSRLPVGAQLTNRDLLHAALMASDNRAVPALGRAVGLSPEQLTAAMNARARELGLKHTFFGDPTGLDHRNVSTPAEVVVMLRAALSYPLIAEICQRPTYVAYALGRQRVPIEYVNTDVLVRMPRYHVLGGKTGYNDQAGYCLAVAARLQDAAGRTRDIAMVFLGAQGKLTRFADFTRAAQWLAERGPGQVRTGSLDAHSSKTL
ncbi:MAG: serine hydrolase [Myxococcales bacterium]|nr:serine hydrolase [Myxococcota bacterium]MDW8283040.1 serine hydrolase [Myxococcales bacterium]